MCRSDKDRAVEQAQVGLERMLGDARGYDGALDTRAQVDELAEVIGGQAYAHLLSRHVGVERATEGKVVTQAAEAGHVHNLIKRVDERRYVVE